jgi:pimeloyl-ACP methyl ester carboxylesterase
VLIDELGGGDPAFVIGNDWGAISTYAAMALHPESVRRSAVIATGHTATLTPTLEHPDQMHHIFHFWVFQLQDMAPHVVRNNDFAFVDYLWRHWSTDGFEDSRHIADVKQTLSQPGATEAALAYYPGLLHLPADHPDVAEKMRGKTTVPTLAIFGEADPPRELSAEEHIHFAAEYRQEIVPGAGHFVHREQPDRVNSLLLEWLAADERGAKPLSQAAA